jgi:RHS repeat-associated protein
LDTEAFAALTGDGTLPEATNLDAASHVPPVLTRTWFHTGIYVGRDHVSDFFAGLLDEHDRGEYYHEPGLTPTQARERLLPDTVMPPGLTLEEEREACRALKGAMLRQEVYALDGTDKAKIPYTVAEQNFTIAPLQPRAGNRHAVFFTHPREALSHHYERNPADPRISHALTLEVDAFGNVLKSAAIGYGRRQPDMTLSAEDRAKQTQLFITYTENRVTNAIEATNDYRSPLPCETRTYELTGLPLPPDCSRFTLAEILTAGTGAAPIAYEQSPTTGMWQKRLIEHVRTLYRPDDLGVAQNDPLALLPLSTAESLALPGESYKLAFTPGLLAGVYGGRVTDAMLDTQGRYVHSEGDANWWIPSGRIFFSPGSADAPAQELVHARTHFFLPRRYRDPFHTHQLNTETVVTFDDHRLLVVETLDALGNTVHAQNDYRVLGPSLMTDPNGNRSEVAFDVLGMVVATAVKGKLGQNLGDLLEDVDPDPPLAALQAFIADPQGQAASLLGKATTRIVYDLDRYPRSGQPPFAATLARETHFADPGGAQTKIQVSFSYSDGFGREIQKKIQAERGDAPQRGPNVTLPGGDMQPGALVRDANGEPVQADTPQRWVGSGRTVFNNKGKPVRQYEPFFSATHLYEEEREMTDTGVSPILFYDPVERVVATLHPNHTWEKVVFDPWQQTTYDVNDTVTDNPKTDDDVKGFFTRLPDAEYLPTWHEARKNGQLGPHEQAAAEKAAVHADTPTVAHADSLGRTFLTIVHNRFERNGAIVEESYPSRVVLDIEGNQREVIDARDRIVMRYDYDMLGTRIHQVSMEAGERWMLNDVAGNPLYAWDSRDHQFRTAYDRLRRPVETSVRAGAGSEHLIGHTIYGETRLNPEVNNLRGKVVQIFDQAGVVTTDEYDFKGNLLRSQRQLAELVDSQGTQIPAYKTTVNWSGAVQLDIDIYTSRTRYDALNRPTEQIAPDNSVYRPSFNEANLLEKVDVNLRGAAVATPFVTDIDYNAKGQRTLIDYGNGVRTIYEHDPLTFHLTSLTTTRPAGLNGLAMQLFKNAGTVQDLHYTYDPAGNITRIADDALPTLFFANRQVDPVGLYTYDAVYRLIEAQGRESLGQSALQLGLPQATYRDYPYAGLGSQPFDPKAVRNYTERYHYDEVGNFLHMIHQGENGAWVRDYCYKENSLIEPGKCSNRLSATVLHPNANQPLEETYTHDAHGNMTAMPHLTLMQWDFKDQLQATSRQAVNEGTPETTYYVYDAAGQRVRKVTERQNGTRKNERIYLGGFEVYHDYDGIGTSVSLERETLHVMDDQQRIALVETRTDTPLPEQLIRFQFGNHLGSASLELDNAGQIISYEEYYPYGSTSYQAGRSVAEVSLKRYRYTGMERDEETGFSYHGARYYTPWLGRWISCDPSGLVEGTNLYWFVRANPIVMIDPAGEEGELPPGSKPFVYTPSPAPPPTPAPAPAPISSVAPMPGGAAGTVAVSAGYAALAYAQQLATGAAILGIGALRHFRSNSIAQYGNPYGSPSEDIGFPLMRNARRRNPPPVPTPDPTSDPKPEVKPAPDAPPKPKTQDDEDRRRPKLRRVYLTYTKTWWDPHGDGSTDLTYSGRATGIVDMNNPILRGRFYDEERDQYVEIDLQKEVSQVLAEGRDRSHHKNKKVGGVVHDKAYLEKFIFGKGTKYDRNEPAYYAIRGREQQLIDYFGGVITGGAQSDTGKPYRTGNKIRGVRKDHPKGKEYHDAATFVWGELFPYTGKTRR